MLNLLFESFVFLLGRLVLFPEFLGIDVAAASEHALDVLDSVARLLRLFVELHEDFGELVHGPGAFEILLELLLLSLDSALC